MHRVIGSNASPGNRYLLAVALTGVAIVAGLAIAIVGIVIGAELLFHIT